MVGQIGYTSGVGSLSDVRIGMTLRVGTSVGAKDLGVCRIRLAPSGTIFYIGETSEINWLAGGTIYLTIVDESRLWPRHLRIVDTVTYMDLGVAYSDQHEKFDPTPLLGSDAVLWLSGDDVSITWPSIDESYVVDGSSIASILWEAPGASATSGLSTSTPTFTYDAPGQYPVYCTLTGSNGKPFTGVRVVYVFSPSSMPEIDFSLVRSPKATLVKGGFEFEVELFHQADQSIVPDNTQVILFTIDYFAGQEQSLGPIAGTENILVSGFVLGGESTTWDPRTGTVRFSLVGAHNILDQMHGYAVYLKLVGSASAWEEMPQLTVGRFIWHLLHWRTTATAVMDIRIPEDSRVMRGSPIPEATLWRQIVDASRQSILAIPVVDRFGRFYCEVDQQLVPEADRSSIPEVMTITKADWGETMEIIRRPKSASRVELSGVVSSLGEEPRALFSLAPGHVPALYGDPISSDHLLLTDQSQANELAAMILANANRPYEFSFELLENNRFLDIAPSYYLNLTVLESDTIRGIEFSGRIVVREIEFAYSAPAWTVRIRAEPETFPDLSQNGDVPGGDEPYEVPDIAPTSIPPIPSMPMIGILPEGSSIGNLALHAAGIGIAYTRDFYGSSPHWYRGWTGLDSNRISGIRYFEIDGTGAFWLITDAPSPGAFGTRNSYWNTGSWGATNIANEIWRCPKPGGSWVKIFDNVQMDPSGYAYPRSPWIVGMEVSPSSGTVTLITRSVYTIFTTSSADTYVGDLSGFVRTSPSGGIVGGYDLLTFGGLGGNMIRMSSGKWLCTDSNRILQLSSLTGPLAIVGTGVDADRLVATSKTKNLTAVWGNNPAWVSLDGGSTFIHDGNPTPYISSSRMQSFGVDASGQYLLVGDSAGIFLKRSSNGGSSWDNSPTISGTVTSVWNLGKPLDWVVGYAHMVRLSTDFFATYVEKTGDLWSTLGTNLPDILSVRSF